MAGKKFPNANAANEEIIFKEFDFFKGYLDPDSDYLEPKGKNCVFFSQPKLRRVLRF